MNILATLQARLIAAFVLVVFVALGVSALVFVLVRRDEAEQRALDRVAAASPPIFSQYAALSFRGSPAEVIALFASEAAQRYEIRVMLLDPSGVVAQDSQGHLQGRKLDLPARTPEAAGDPHSFIERIAVGAGGAVAIPPDFVDEAPLAEATPARERGVTRPAPSGAGALAAVGRFAGPPYRVWRPGPGSPADGLILVTADLPQLRLPPAQRGDLQPQSYALVLAVPESTVTRAWLDLLPALGIAAGIAIPTAVLLAILLARYISRPLQQLTVASQHLAAGNFDIEVPRGRRDEVGRLSRAFATMAERLGATNREMRTLVANVSHDLKTPLTSILGFSRALETGAVDGDDVAQTGAVIHEEAGRLARRLEDLLLLSELDAGQALLRADRVDLARLVASVVRRVLAASGGTAPEPLLDMVPGLTVTADVAKLERIVENLLDNARKFTPPDGRITVTVRPADEPVDRVTIAVANTAPPGLTADDIPRFFDRFYRRDRSRAGADGTGLGLPIARDLVALHGGTLEGALVAGEVVLTVTLAKT
jgi:signal transduction histidine kinase